MAYRLKRNDLSVEAAARRIACEQIDAAAAELADSALPNDEKIHALRKRCKQLRALVRLIRPGFPGYADANRLFRGLAAPLSVLRDADVVIATCDLVAAKENTLDIAPVRRQLLRQRAHLQHVADPAARLSAFGAGLASARAEIVQWVLDTEGFDVIGAGAGRVYRSARKAMARAARTSDAGDFHDWRKGVKYHWYHTRLLAGLWPDEQAVHADAAKALGERLGAHHDLAVLHHMLASRPGDYGGAAIVAPVIAALDRAGGEEARAALAEGALLLSEAPDALINRWRGYWQSWHAPAEATA